MPAILRVCTSAGTMVAKMRLRPLLRRASILMLATVSLWTSPGVRAETPERDKRIALSFDDAPRGNGPRFSGAQRTQALIAALAKAQSGPCVFFVKTEFLDRAQDRSRIEDYAAAGHLIANHTHTHPWASRTETNTYIADIDAAATRLQGFENWRPWFRFPYLDEGRPLEKREALRTALAKRNLRNGYVTVDNYDWYLEAQWMGAVRAGRSVDLETLGAIYVEVLLGAVAFYDRIGTEVLGRTPAHVLLLHENDLAALFIGDLIRALRHEGWTIISPDTAYQDPVAAQVPKTLKTRQGHVAALAIDEGLDPRTLTHLAIEEDQIDALLAKRTVFGPLSPQSDPAP